MLPAVVLDANAYRGLAGARFEALVALERQKRISPYADPWVLMELLAHLADSRDPDFRRCLNAVRRIWVRCVSQRDAATPGGMINDSESQLALYMTGKPLAA